MSVAIAVSNDSLQITDVRRRLKAIFIGSIGNLVRVVRFLCIRGILFVFRQFLFSRK